MGDQVVELLVRVLSLGTKLLQIAVYCFTHPKVCTKS